MVLLDLPNFSIIICRVHLYVDMLQFFNVSILAAPLLINDESPNGDVSEFVGVAGAEMMLFIIIRIETIQFVKTCTGNVIQW